MKNNPLKALPPGITVVYPDNRSYDQDRVISNARFNYRPMAIAYCANASDVSICIRYCISNNYPFRIRSGGHQHEGMCSANGIFMIDLTKMSTIEYGPGNNTAWIPSGIHLQDVYNQLQ